MRVWIPEDQILVSEQATIDASNLQLSETCSEFRKA